MRWPRGASPPCILKARDGSPVKAVAAVASGESVHAVAKRLGLAYQTVQWWHAE